MERGERQNVREIFSPVMCGGERERRVYVCELVELGMTKESEECSVMGGIIRLYD